LDLGKLAGYIATPWQAGYPPLGFLSQFGPNPALL
jgi:hypothetical protein